MFWKDIICFFLTHAREIRRHLFYNVKIFRISKLKLNFLRPLRNVRSSGGAPRSKGPSSGSTMLQGKDVFQRDQRDNIRKKCSQWEADFLATPLIKMQCY